ncbi:hypothetical protein B296_00033100 [Ensete ventricosum]|uniref:Uncharacterized protein n=1 Tax=Ensete ventricosum TaxID=4639 RepID=A0A426YHC2_ENSVE|nr:hypothetical protein B296_00033100 [Ensete ventricosum]
MGGRTQAHEHRVLCGLFVGNVAGSRTQEVADGEDEPSAYTCQDARAGDDAGGALGSGAAALLRRQRQICHG